jgi:peptidoglycan-associated lipoprotein
MGGGAAGSAGGPGAAGPGVAGATGTTIPALPSPKEFVETSALRDVHFDFDRYEVRAQDKPVLDENAKWLKQNAGALLLIEGHADERGTNEYNLALGERRAKATRDHLVSLGVDGGRITVISYGGGRSARSDGGPGGRRTGVHSSSGSSPLVTRGERGDGLRRGPGVDPPHRCAAPGPPPPS